MAWKFFGKVEKKASAVGALNVQFNANNPVFTERAYEPLAREAYMTCVTAYRCITLISRSASTVNWRVMRGDTEVKSHPLVTLLEKPNPMQGGVEFMESLFSYYLIAGNTYMETVEVSGGTPRELYVLRPDRVKVIAGSLGLPKSYRYDVSGKHKDFPVDQITGDSKVMHVKSFHPLNEWYGMSPLEAAAYSVDQHNDASKWNKSLLQNSGRPSGALVYKPTTDGDTMTEEQRAFVRSELEANYTGAGNAGRPLVLEGGLTWMEMSLSMKEMDFLKGKSMTAMEVALAFDVPAQLVGVQGSLTFNNYEQARMALYDDAVLPLLARFKEELNLWIARYYPTLTIDFDIDSISALAPRREAKLKLVNDAEYISINEKRKIASRMLGLDLQDRDDGDVLVDQNTNPIKPNDGGGSTNVDVVE